MMGKLNLKAWRDIDAPDYILKWVECGMPVPFRPCCPDPVFMENHVKGAKEYNFVDQEIERLVQEGAITETVDPPHVCFTNTMCTQKGKQTEDGS